MSTNDQEHNKPLIIPQIVIQYQNLSEKNNNFQQLHMHEQRAVKREVELQVLGHQESETYSRWTGNPNNAALLGEALTRNYSDNPQKVKELVIRDNRANYMQGFSHNIQADRKRRTLAIAEKLDKNYQTFYKNSTLNKTSER